MTTSSGKLRSNETFTNLIENLGDAYEAAEECYGMVQWLADWLAVCQAGSTASAESLARDRKRIIREAQQCYREGLAIGGVQKA